MEEANDYLPFLMMHAVQVARVNRYPKRECYAAGPISESRRSS